MNILQAKYHFLLFESIICYIGLYIIQLIVGRTINDTFRSQVGQSASAFYYASMSLIAYSDNCLNVNGRAKQTMRDFSDDMELIDQNPQHVRFTEFFICPFTINRQDVLLLY